MCVDVIDLLRDDTGVVDGVPHDTGCAFAVLGRRGDVKGVAAHAIADDFRQNGRAPSLREPEFLD